jgi:hypothetical protein
MFHSLPFVASPACYVDVTRPQTLRLYCRLYVTRYFWRAYEVSNDILHQSLQIGTIRIGMAKYLLIHFKLARFLPIVQVNRAAASTMQQKSGASIDSTYLCDCCSSLSIVSTCAACRLVPCIDSFCVGLRIPCCLCCLGIACTHRFAVSALAIKAPQ